MGDRAGALMSPGGTLGLVDPQPLPNILTASPGLAGEAPGTTAGSATMSAFPATRVEILFPLNVKNDGARGWIVTVPTSPRSSFERPGLATTTTLMGPDFVIL